MIKDMIVKSVRYFETNRGLGYEEKLMRVLYGMTEMAYLF